MPTATKKYCTRLKLPEPMSVITATAATTALTGAGTPKMHSAAPMPANSDTVVPRLADEHRHRRERRPAHAEALADQAHQALARGQAHARTDLLGDEQRDLGGQDHPQQVVAEFRAGDRVGRDAAGVVVGKAADDARAEDGQRGEQPDAPCGSRGTAPPDVGAAGARRRSPRQPRVDHRRYRENVRQPLLPGRREHRVERVVDRDDALEDGRRRRRPARRAGCSAR